MRLIHLLPPLLLAGCQSAPPATVSSASPLSSSPELAAAAAPSPAAAPTHGDLERKLRLQAQHLEALMSQNDALKTRLAANPTAPAVSPPLAPASATVMPPIARLAATPSTATEQPALMPNADGVIDLSAPMARAGDLPNPFALRTAPEGPVRELQVHVSGLIAGPVACAVINGRLVQAGDAVEPLSVERVEAEAVVLRFGERRLRLPLAERPVRVRLPN